MIFGHFLQSKEWEKYEQMEGHETLRLKGDGFEALVAVMKTAMGEYFYLPYGPVIEVNEGETAKDVLERALVALTKEALKKGAFLVRIEPTIPLVDNSDKYGITEDELRKLGLKKSHDLDPASTWVVDLQGSQADLLSRMEKVRAKHWRNHEAHGLKLRKTTDPEEIVVLTKFLEQLGETRQFAPQSEAHLKNQLKAGFATLYIAEYEGEPVAASLVHDYDGVRYAMHAAADETKKNLRAGAIISVEEMVDAQKAGAREFDFWGMTKSEDPKHPWYGFTKHKQSFGGEGKDYTGTWDLPINRVKYGFYQVLRKVNRMKRRLRKSS